MDWYHFLPNKIFNLDETGISTVLPSPKIIAETGKKQVGQVVARECGELVTVCCIIAANGNSLRPVFVFPKICLGDYYLAGVPTGFLQHVQQQTNCSSENPILLLLDNHSSHITVESVSFAKDHGVALLTIAPHCSHRMQPLDSSLFGPFKAALRVAVNDLTRSLASQNKVIRVENIASLEFLYSYVSDRPLPNEATNEIHGNYLEEDPGAVAISPQVSFENVKGKENPVVDVTVDGATTNHSAKDSIGGPLTPSARHAYLNPKVKLNRVTQKKNGSETEESDVGMELLSENEVFDSSDSVPSGPVSLIDSNQIEIGDFLMVKFTDTKDNAVFYVGQVQVKGNEEYEVKYLREKGNKFVFPDVDDISVVPRQDIFSKLPRPKEMRGTK
ncbi:hypothetical protein PR048_002353 [Dryococelus australis]|uniref:DDE-1 domain-containing protein n=1 Tax=Dryococelus australis TaxID=614101 RepID=A0ABQ9IKN1_9NEOP|nr:hypothetical protein PR048_002353 [Dryococelus australis]